MLPFPSQISILLLLCVYATTTHISMCSSNQRVVRCNEKDQRALSIFKQGITDLSSYSVSTWSTEQDCCSWEGVQCDNTTGRVTSLDLHYPGDLEGEIKLSWLLQLEFLNYLDLSGNNFTSVSIPPIHHNITPTTTLHYLDLSYNYYLVMDNLHWLSQLSSLKYLNLSNVNLQNEVNWLHIVAMLPSLSELQLRGCGLTNIYPSLMYVNFTSLVTLDLSGNNFNSELPHWLFNLTSGISGISLTSSNLYGEIPLSLLKLSKLKFIDLFGNQFNGSIPNWLGQHEHLQHIYLFDNLFSGYIPSSLGNLSSLIYLDISSNLLRGNLPYSLGQLFNLHTLRVGNNVLSGILSEMLFSKLSKLETLDLSSSNFKFDIDKNWIPSFQLTQIDLSNTIQGPNFPAWLYTQHSIHYLDISNTRISSINGDMLSFIAGDKHIYLSNNSISGDISNVTLNSTLIFLNHNNFTGGLPHISTNVEFVDVSHNSFSGGFPKGWMNSKDLIYISMASNKLAGEVPLDMSNLTQLEFINLGKNEFSGNMPIRMPPSLRLMILRSNQFVGNIPLQLCYLSSLHILDLAHNKLSGSIPHCVHKMTHMISSEYPYTWGFGSIFNLIIKKEELEYKTSSDYKWPRTIDLSTNNLSGDIPLELFRLVKIQSLNLSYNHLTGTVPKAIGNMKNLESLDLSHNQLVGEIPLDISRLNFLSVLNISYNNFRGPIPLGTQLQTFDEWSYIGNPGLCGAPLVKNCTEKENQYKGKQHAGNKDGDSFRESLYLGMGVGFAVGFWGVCGSLFLNRTCRHMYYRFLNHVADGIFVIVTVKFGSFGG